MSHETYDVRSADGTRLTAYRWEPEGDVRGDLLLNHGGMEHMGRYDHVAAAFNKLGLRVHGVDLRGHGLSDGKRGHVDHWGQFLEDIESVAKTLTTPYVLVGHSIGGLNSILHLRDHADRVSCAVLSAPYLAPTETPAAPLRVAARLLSRIAPKLSLDNGLTPDMISTDESTVRAYEADPLVYGTITARFARAYMTLSPEAQALAPSLKTPAFFLWGTADPIASPTVIQQFASAYGGEATTRMHEGLKHECFNEVDRERVIAEVVGWIEAQLAG